MIDSNKFRFKITVIGDGYVGKTTLIKNFTHEHFRYDYVKTIWAQFSKYNKKIEDDEIGLLFWDIAGQDNFIYLRPSFYRETKAAIIVYSLEENDLGTRSFEHIKDWHDDLKKHCGDIPVVLFANKVDLINEDTLDRNDIQKVVKELNFLGYYITSAKTGQGVDEAFNAIIENLYYKYKEISLES